MRKRPGMKENCYLCGKVFTLGRRTKYCSEICSTEAGNERSRKHREVFGPDDVSLSYLKLRFDILVRDNFTCQYCGRKPEDGTKLEVDHILPSSKGGKTTERNLITACFECNQGKKARTLLEIRQQHRKS